MTGTYLFNKSLNLYIVQIDFEILVLLYDHSIYLSDLKVLLGI